MLECLKQSILYEGDKPNNEQLMKIVDYSNSLKYGEAPDLKIVFNLFKPELDIVRKEDVVVCSNNSFQKYFNVNHVGMKPEYINLDKIQDTINDFYKHPTLIEGFRLYIQFELIHPFIDGNGRTGRFIFIEHPFKCYLSSILVKKRLKLLHQQLFSIYCKKIRLYYNGDKLYYWKTHMEFIYPPEDSYYDLKLNDKVLTIIQKLLTEINKVILED